ncbi:hypothetical protein [Streptomyces sp. NPDC057552]|uniref:hypothetical protein n=1 Tax=Streptomyces sp. NPDC057552 TaxID=3350537 RepID=UPI0036897445
MRTSTIRRVGTGAAVVALMSVAACSGGGGGNSGSGTESKPKAAGAAGANHLAALQQIQKKSGTAQSARVEGTTKMGDAVSMKQTGAISWADGLTGSLTITYTGGTMAEQQGGPKSVEARYFKDAYYADMGKEFAAQSGGKRWVRYAFEDLAELGGPAGDAMKEQLQKQDPQEGVKALLAAGDVKKVGQEDVRGVSATRYSGTVDVAELTARNSALDAEQLEALKEQLSAAGVTTQTVDIWVDKDDLLVKKTERGESALGAFNTTAFYSDYGTAVSVEKPPASDTADFTELLKQEGAGLS